MTKYRNLGSNSGVAAYEVGSGVITVRFRDGAVYECTNDSAGANNIDQMIRLAEQGRGLNSFINRVVSKSYARRLR